MKTRAKDFFEGRVGLQQRVLPAYRVPFFDRLASACKGGLNLFAGAPRPDEAIWIAEGLGNADVTEARNLHLLRGPFYFCLQPGILDWLREQEPEALILEANPRYLSNRSAIAWMQRRKRPVIGWGLGAPSISGLSAGFRERVRSVYLSGFDALIAYSTLGAEQYRAAGFPQERTFIAYNAVSPPPPTLIERVPTSGHPVRVLFVGRLQARKRIDLLLKACGKLKTLIALTIVGDGPERTVLERLAAKTCPQTRFVGGQYAEALKPYYDQADLFVLPGTGGLAVQQAMAHGLPVVVAQGDGTQEDLVSSGNGWLVPPGDLQALTNTLEEAISAPKRLRDMGRRSHRLVEERFNIDSMVEVFIRVLRFVSGGQ